MLPKHMCVTTIARTPEPENAPAPLCSASRARHATSFLANCENTVSCSLLQLRYVLFQLVHTTRAESTACDRCTTTATLTKKGARTH